MQQETVKVTQEGPVTIITLDDPATRNAISDLPTVDAIVNALQAADSDPEARVVILTATGPVFSSGGNLKRMGEPGELGGGAPVETRLGYKQGIQRIPLAFQSLEIPVIAAVNGPAVGAGCDLACMCDIRIAARSASFAESFVKVGLIPGDGGAWLLQRAVGFAKAAEMSFTGESISADEALRCGLVSRLVDDADLMPAARELALKIAANPPHAVRMTKRLLTQARDARLDTLLDLSAAMQAVVHTTSDHGEAVDAFRNKRKPNFTGN